MKIVACFVAVVALVGMCTNGAGGRVLAQSNQLIEYQVQGDQYAVIVVQDGLSEGEAKKKARQRAAEITVQNGGRYFTVDSEIETRVLQPSGDWPNNQNTPGNMYQ